MKSQMLTVLLLIIGAFFFQPTHQYRISKRELTEYDLTSFIVGTCSARKIDTLIQSLCDQTLQSALMGNFPFLIYYCKTIGVGMSYCKNMNRHMVIDQDTGAKGFAHRRHVRSLNRDNKLYQKGQEMDIETGLEQKMIMQICLTKTEKSSVDTDQFCNQTLQAIQQGRYPEIQRFCKYHLGSDYCRHVWSYSSSFSWPLLESPSILSSSSDSIIPNINPSFVSSSVSKPSDIESIIDQQRIDKENQELSS
jgi:hypothetical protein